MGAGFALYVSAEDAERTVKLARDCGVPAWVAGSVEVGPKRLIVEPLNLTWDADALQLR